MSSTLLARFAQNVFWMGRYIERVDNLARILDINETYARETRGKPDWQRVLAIFEDKERFFKNHDQAGAQDVLSFYVLEQDNPGSVAAAVKMARENARSVRHLISTEMWTHLNMFHGRVMGLTQRDIRVDKVSGLCKELKEGCQTFEGIAEGTFFRGSAWYFYNIGKYLERADQTTRVLFMACDLLSGAEEEGDAVNTVQWNALLRSVAAYHAFRWVRPNSHKPRDIVNFLLYDHGFPRSVALCADRIGDHLEELIVKRGQPRHETVEDARGRFVFTLNTGLGNKVAKSKLKRFLDDLERALNRLSNAIAGGYFNIK